MANNVEIPVDLIVNDDELKSAVDSSYNIDIEAGVEVDKSAIDDLSSAEIELEANIDTQSATDSLNGLQQFVSNTFGKEFEAVFGKLSGLATTFVGVLSKIKPATLSGAGAMKILKVALASTGIGALVLAVGSLISYFTATQEGADKLKQVFDGLGAGVAVIVDRLSQFGSGLLEIFSGNFAKGIDILTDSFKGIGEEILNESKAAYQLAGAFAELEDKRVAQIVPIAKMRREISALRLEAEDESLAIGKRIELLEKSQKLENQIADTERDLLATRVKILDNQVALGNSTRDEIEELENLKAELIGVDQTRDERLKSYARRLKSLRAERDRESQSLKDNSEVINENIKTLLALEKAGKRNSDEYNNLFKKTSDLVVADKQLNEQTELLKENLGLGKTGANDFTSVLVELEKQTKNIQLDIDIEKLKSSTAEISKFSNEAIDLQKIAKVGFDKASESINKYYSDYEENLKKNTELLTKQSEKEKEIGLLELTKRQSEELAKIEESNNKNLAKYKEGSEERIKLEQEQAKLISAVKEKQETETLNFEASFSNKVISLKDEETQKLKSLEEKKANDLITIQKQYEEAVISSINAIGGAYGSVGAEISNEIFKLSNLLDSNNVGWEEYGQIVSNVLGSVGKLATENAEVQKALALTQAIVNTAVAVTKALQLPPPLNFIQAGLIGAVGALQVATILGAEDGVVGLDSSYNKKPGRTDTIPFMLAKGESVINAQSTAVNRPFLEYANNGGNLADLFNPLLSETRIQNRKIDALNKNLSRNGGMNLVIENRNNSKIRAGRL